MDQRVYGLENEYLLLYEPAPGETRGPSRHDLYELLESHIRERYPALPARGSDGGIFLGNGSRLYEAPLEGPEDALAEFNTPECISARELCVYHRAVDEMLRRALPALRKRLAAQGFRGRLSIAKANVDRDGHTFGACENYLVDDRLPGPLAALRVVGQGVFTVLSLVVHLSTRLPLFLVALALASLLVGTVAVLAVLVPFVFVTTLLRGESRGRRWLEFMDELTTRMVSLFDSDRAVRWLGLGLNLAVVLPVVGAYSLFARAVHFRRFRRWLVPFAVTRTVYAGNGRVDLSRGPAFFRLSSRADSVRASWKLFWDESKPILDLKHLLMDLAEPWRRRKRLPLLYSDGHLCERALWLSAGATGLVLEAIEAGAFEGAVETRLEDPIGALRALNADPTLRATVRLTSGEEITAVAHQRRYLAIVREHLARAPVVNLQKAAILRLWEQTLDALEQDPAELYGAVDWITKRTLIEEVAGGNGALEKLGAWAKALCILDRASIDDDDLEADGKEFRRVLAERMHIADRRELEAEIARAGLDPDDLPRMARLAYQVRKIDHKYHDLDPEEGYAALLARAGVLATVVTEGELEHALANPPALTRAHARGTAIARAAAAGHRGKAAWRKVVDYDARESVRLPDPLSPHPRRRGDRRAG